MSGDRYLIPLIERLGSAVVGCVGDLMVDHFIYGDVSRISPEAPIPVLRVQSQQSMLGGVGNVVRNLGSLGCGMKVFSVTGSDAPAGEIQTLLGKVPRCQPHVICEPGRTTPVKVRYVASGQQLLRTDQETTSAISAASLQGILSEFEAAIAGCHVVVLSDYAKGVLVGSLAGEFIRLARAQGKRVIVDPKGTDFSRYRYATIIKPNLKELAEATGSVVTDTASLEAAARKLLAQTEAEYILVTRGPDGILLVPREGEVLRLPALAREVFDVSGAGDTVAATLAAGLGAGASVPDAVRLANIAAGIVVGKAGTAVVERAEIVHEIEQQSALAVSDKVMRLEQVREQVQMWRRMGLKTGLLSGSFDQLSPECLAALERARGGCDRLVVAIENDSALTVQGVPGRPDQNARAYLLASTVFSDAVVIHNNQAAESLAAILQPDSVSVFWHSSPKSAGPSPTANIQ